MIWGDENEISEEKAGRPICFELSIPFKDKTARVPGDALEMQTAADMAEVLLSKEGLLDRILGK